MQVVAVEKVERLYEVVFHQVAIEPLQMRRDLVVRRQRWQAREYWTVKDPLTLKYYRFENEEFAILSMLDGQTSSDAIRETAIRRPSRNAPSPRAAHQR